MENNDSFTKLKESTQKLFDAQKKRLNNEDRIETLNGTKLTFSLVGLMLICLKKVHNKRLTLVN
ncbi:hypothetical protein A2G60_04895 [Streptococcus pneumoniae]|nr:hypothetical protein A2G60_04895 [Streptococcus pneumoniae]